jgi:hypothetical protein
MENVMKKISWLGVILGMLVAGLAVLFSGSWVFWLSVGLAAGVLIGATQARRSLARDARLSERSPS